MTKKKGSQNSVQRSIARGAEARGTTGINNNGAEAHKRARQSNTGHYRIEFTQVYERMTEKDLSLRKTYGIDLIASNVGVPADMITLVSKKKSGELTLTSLDEVYYVKVGKDNYGKLSIRTQRLWKSATLIFVFQVKKTVLKSPQKAFSRTVGFRARTASQKSEASRKSYRTRKGGKT